MGARVPRSLSYTFPTAAILHQHGMFVTIHEAWLILINHECCFVTVGKQTHHCDSTATGGCLMSMRTFLCSRIQDTT